MTYVTGILHEGEKPNPPSFGKVEQQYEDLGENYSFDNLSAVAKGKAISNYRQAHADDNDACIESIRDRIASIKDSYGVGASRGSYDLEGYPGYYAIAGSLEIGDFIQFVTKSVPVLENPIWEQAARFLETYARYGFSITFYADEYRERSTFEVDGAVMDVEASNLDSIPEGMSAREVLALESIDIHGMFVELAKDMNRRILSEIRKISDWYDSDEYILEEIEAIGPRFHHDGTLFGDE